MKMEMTKRDKQLLLFLGVFVILVGFGYWGIRPQVKAINELNLDIEAAKDLKSLNEMKISMNPMVKADNEALEKKVLSVRENFYPMMKSDEIDKHFTEMALGYGLSVYSLNISRDDEEVESKPYQYSEKFENEELNAEEGYVEEEGTTTDIESIDNYAETGYTDFYEDEVKPSTGIYVATVSMKLEGEREDLERLVDDLSLEKKNHLLRSYDWSEGNRMVMAADGNYEALDEIFLDITVDIYQAKE